MIKFFIDVWQVTLPEMDVLPYANLFSPSTVLLIFQYSHRRKAPVRVCVISIVQYIQLIGIFFAGQVTGIMIATVALNAYLLDAYPEGSGEVGAWITMGRTMGGFMAVYTEIDWVTQSGPIDTFAVQTAITATAGFIILALGLFGKRLRKAQGRMNFAMESGY